LRMVAGGDGTGADARAARRRPAAFDRGRTANVVRTPCCQSDGCRAPRSGYHVLVFTTCGVPVLLTF
jgi:hypothetical protein